MKFLKSLTVGLCAALTIVQILSTAGLTHARSAATANVRLRKLASVAPRDIGGSGTISRIFDYVICHQNETILVAYSNETASGKPILRIRRLGIQSKSTLGEVSLENGSRAKLTLSPDERSLLVISETRIFLIDVQKLNVVSSIDLLGTFPYWLQYSNDGRVFADMTVSEGNSAATIHVYEASTGVELGHWTKLNGRGYPLPTSISGREGTILMVDPRQDNDIQLVNSLDGRIVRSFSSGFGRERGLAAGGIGGAYFTTFSQFLVTFSTDTGDTGQYGGTAIKVFDATTGHVTRELTRDHLAPSEPWISEDAKEFGILNAWRTSRQNFADSDVPLELLFFSLDGNGPVASLKRIPFSSTISEDDIKLSHDLGLIGIKANGQINIFKIIR